VPNILTLTVSNPDQILNTGAYGAGAVIQVQSALLQAGPFNDDGTVAIVSGTTSYTYYDTNGTSDTWYRTRYENALGTTVSDWSQVFQPHVSFISLAEAQARIGEGITQAMLDEVESAWAAMLGPLAGERTETFFLYQRRHRFMDVDGVYLTRTTDAVTSLTTSTTTGPATTLAAGTDYRLLNNYLIERIDTGEVWYDQLVATYSPNDEELVRSVIFDTLTYRQTPAGLQSIRIGAYSETFFPSATQSDPVLGSLARRVLPAAGLGVTSPFRYTEHRRDRTHVVAT
jgi:hypothetical protein